MGGFEMGMMEAVVCILLELQRLKSLMREERQRQTVNVSSNTLHFGYYKKRALGNGLSGNLFTALICYKSNVKLVYENLHLSGR